MKPFGFYQSVTWREVKLDITILRNTPVHIAQLCPLILLVICVTFGGERESSECEYKGGLSSRLQSWRRHDSSNVSLTGNEGFEWQKLRISLVSVEGNFSQLAFTSPLNSMLIINLQNVWCRFLRNRSMFGLVCPLMYSRSVAVNAQWT